MGLLLIVEMNLIQINIDTFVIAELLMRVESVLEFEFGDWLVSEVDEVLLLLVFEFSILEFDLLIGKISGLFKEEFWVCFSL